MRSAVSACLALVLCATMAAHGSRLEPDSFHRTLTLPEQQQLQVEATILLQPEDAISLQTRADAATALLDLDSLESIAVLNDAIRSGRSAPLLAVLMADARRPRPSPDLLASLLAVLPDAPADTVGSIGILLARYSAGGTACFETITTMAMDPDRPLDARLRAAEVLGAFRTYPDRSIRALITILGRSDAPAPLVQRSMQSLETLTGRSMPRQQWAKWWTNQDEDSVELLRASIDSLNRSTVDSVHQLQQARSEANQSSMRMIRAYQDLLPLLSLQQQQAKVLELLDDPRADVRGFAIERVALMLGDANDTPELQTAIARLLADPDTANRRRVATLLKELGQEDVEVIVLTRLEIEDDDQVLKSMLAYLQERRSVAAVDATRTLLADPGLREQAANTLRSILLANPELDMNEQEKIARAARTALAPSNWQTIAPLLVLTGNEDDLRSLEVILDNPDPAVRSSVAEAFLQRGRHEALLARASDEEIYPYALTAAQRNARDLATLRLLLGMAPPPAYAERWSDAVADAVDIQEPHRILEIDDMIGAMPHANDPLRIRVLNASLSRGELEMQLQARILKRLVPMLLEQDSPAAALTLIQGLDEMMLDEKLQDMKFISAIRARLYDDAFRVHDDPDMWIRAYQDTIASRPESAADLVNEIVRRYDDALTPQRRALLGLAEDPLMPSEDEAVPPGDEAPAETP